MSNEFTPKAGSIKIGGLGPKAAKLQALRDKAAKQKNGGKSFSDDNSASMKAKTFTGAKKTSFNRKAV